MLSRSSVFLGERFLKKVFFEQRVLKENEKLINETFWIRKVEVFFEDVRELPYAWFC